MRLHQLEVTAFGPFASTCAVDLDDLASDGLFLLCGPTGAGKSSVLDAVCFALYGQVPGDRAGARHLRSDQAAPDVAPRVVLELTLGERRLRITRSPAWERSKRRGTGTTTEPASVLVEERDPAGAWTHLTGRIDEAGQLLGRLVGLTLGQFCQVVLLPQGGFQQFLRAGTKDRQALLQSIFRTRRYADVEAWLAEQRRARRASSLAGLGAVRDVVSRLGEAADAAAEGAVPEIRFDAPAGDPALLPGAPDGVLAWADERRATAATTAQAQEAALAAAVERHAAAATDHRLVEHRTTLRERGRRASVALARLAERTEEVEALRERRADALRAAPTAGHLTARDTARTRSRRAQHRWEDAVRALGPAAHEATGVLALDLDDVPADLDLATTRAALDDLAARRHRCADASRLQEGLDDLTRRLAARATEAAGLEAEEARCADDALALPGRLDAARERADAGERAAAALTDARERLATARTRVGAAREAARVALDAAAAEAEHEAARLRVVTAKEAWLRIAERRVEGMASELAHQLAVGGACPVCGSCEHPSPAPTAPHLPDAAEEKRARRVVDDAELELAARADRSRTLSVELARHEALAEGQDVAHWAAAVAAATSELQQLEQRAAQAADATAQVAALEQQVEAVARRRADLGARRAALAAHREADEARQADLARQVRRVLAAEDAPSLDVALARLDELAAAWEAVADATRAREQARAALAEAEAAAEEAATAAGFDGADAAAGAVLPARDLHETEAELRLHDDALAESRAVLEDPEVAAELAVDAPDLGAARSALARAEDELARTRTAATLARGRAERLTDLVASLRAALAAWEPERAAYDVADRVATLASGRAADNRHGLALPAYVVAWRLGQVVEAANVRLAPMTAARYVLVQRGSGLDLDVRDEWSGELRDPATLSGGETFLVSLSLALGLADVVLAESAADAEGSDLETLFVDEGFGSLDADTLDDVMDVLDGLRDGGRVVGVVSHVSELRSRITTQLHVRPDRTGSTVRVVHATA